MKWVCLAIVVFAFVAFCGQSRDAEQAHVYADGVLLPKFLAAMNDFTLQHPTAPAHVKTLNARDLKRWQVAREVWKELDASYKAAGY